MKRTSFFLTLVILGMVMAPLTLLAEGEKATTAAATEEAKVTGSASLGVFNKYVFRGYELSRRSFVVQPGLSASFRGFTATFWGNVDSRQHDTQSFFPSNRGKDGKKEWNETDLTLSYTHSVGKVSLTGGYIFYNTKYTDETEEFFVSAGYDMIGKPTLAVYQDVNAYTGTYVNLSLSHSIPVYKEVTLDLGASGAYFAGRNRYWKTYETATGGYTGKKYKAFHDGMVKVGLTIPITKAIFFQPSAQYWYPLSGDAGRKVAGVSYNPNGYLGSVFVGGATVVFNF